MRSFIVLHRAPSETLLSKRPSMCYFWVIRSGGRRKKGMCVFAMPAADHLLKPAPTALLLPVWYRILYLNNWAASRMHGRSGWPSLTQKHHNAPPGQDKKRMKSRRRFGDGHEFGRLAHLHMQTTASHLLNNEAVTHKYFWWSSGSIHMQTTCQ